MSVESPSVLDTCFANLPLYQSIGDQLHTRFTPLRPYEGFSSDVCERAGKEDRYEEQKAILKKGLLYFLEFTVEYDPGKICFSNILVEHKEHCFIPWHLRVYSFKIKIS